LSDNHWESELTELKQRQALAKLMGGDAKVKRQHDAGRMTVRERITALLDPESFHEIGELSGFSNYSVDGKLDKIQPANVLIGRGRINSRTVVINADDFTVRGGAADASIFQKQLAAEQMARELRLPLIRLIEGTGGGGSVKSLEDMGYTYVPFLPGWDHVIANGLFGTGTGCRIRCSAADDKSLFPVGSQHITNVCSRPTRCCCCW